VPQCDACTVEFLGDWLCGPCRDQRLAAIYPPPVNPNADPSSILFWHALAIGAPLVFLAAIFTRTVSNFFEGLVQSVPFAGLALLGYAGRRREWAAVLAGLVLCGLLGLVAGGTGLFTLILFVQQAPKGAPGIAVSPVQLAGVGFAGLTGVLVGMLALVPAVRQWAARCTPLEPRSLVHALALGLVAGTIVIGFGQLIVLGAQPLMLSLLKVDPNFAREIAKSNLQASMLYGLLWTVIGAVFAVGFPLARNARDAFERLGLVKPTLKQVGAALGIAVLLVGVSALLDTAIGGVWRLAGWPRTDASAFEVLIKPLITPAGAVVIGVTAGIGEEVTARGALQPRLGIVLSNLFFTALHAYQYSFDGLLSVFVIGVVLGIVRSRSNTTTACIVHGVYDFILVMAAVLGIGS
jgi:hypothetical protein